MTESTGRVVDGRRDVETPPQHVNLMSNDVSGYMAKGGIRYEVVVILPAYNEAQFLANAVEITGKYLAQVTNRWSIVIVEDGSTDDSEKIARKLANANRRIVHLHSDKRLGRGLAISSAMNNLDADIYCYLDCDLATDMTAFPSLIARVRSGADLVTGSRYLSRSSVERPTLRLVVSRGYNILVRLFLRDPVSDHQCGFKAFSREIVNSLLAECTSRHWFWDTEVLVRAWLRGYTVVEIPVKWRENRAQRTPLVRLLKDIGEHGTGLFGLWLGLHRAYRDKAMP